MLLSRVEPMLYPRLLPVYMLYAPPLFEEVVLPRRRSCGGSDGGLRVG